MRVGVGSGPVRETQRRPLIEQFGLLGAQSGLIGAPRAAGPCGTGARLADHRGSARPPAPIRQRQASLSLLCGLVLVLATLVAGPVVAASPSPGASSHATGDGTSSQPSSSPQPVTQAQIDEAMLSVVQLDARAVALRDQMALRTATIDSLRKRRSNLAEEVAAGEKDVAQLTSKLRATRKAIAGARAALAKAKAAQSGALEVRKSAQEAQDQAQSELSSAQAKLTLANDARSRTASALKAAGSKLTARKYGSASYRSAFSSWQRAAVEAKAADARAVLAQELASNSALGLAAVQGNFEQAQAAVDKAGKDVRAQAAVVAARKAEAKPISAALEQAQSQLDTAATQVKAVRRDLKAATSEQDADAAELASVTHQSAAAEAIIVAAGLTPPQASTTTEPASTAPTATGSSETAPGGSATQPQPAPATTAPPVAEPEVVAAPGEQSPGSGSRHLLPALLALVAGVAAAVAGLVLVRRPSPAAAGGPTARGDRGRRDA